MTIQLNAVVVSFLFHFISSNPISHLHLKKSFFETPNFAVSANSKEGIDIAQKIAELFNRKNRPINVDYPSKDGFQTTKIFTSSAKQTSINFNFNVAVDVADGKITRIRLPHGDLLLLFIAADSRNRVNVNAINFKEFLGKTIGTTHMVRITQTLNNKANNGIAFMSWAKPDIQEERMTMRKTRRRTSASQMHDQITNNEVVRDQWNKGVVPKFPFYHGINTLESKDSNYRKVEQEKTEPAPLANDEASSPYLGINSFSNGFTNTKQCTTRNGETSCKEEQDIVKSPCQGFSIGGNCNGQNDAIVQDTRKSPQLGGNEFQMGHFSDPNQRFGLNRVSPPSLGEKGKNQMTQRTTVASTNTITISTTISSQEKNEVATMSPELQEMRDHIMEMNAHDLRDAIMDPMMLAMGTIMAMSGAYMAMVMAETSAASALALGAFNG